MGLNPDNVGCDLLKAALMNLARDKFQMPGSFPEFRDKWERIAAAYQTIENYQQTLTSPKEEDGLQDT